MPGLGRERRILESPPPRGVLSLNRPHIPAMPKKGLNRRAGALLSGRIGGGRLVEATVPRGAPPMSILRDLTFSDHQSLKNSELSLFVPGFFKKNQNTKGNSFSVLIFFEKSWYKQT